MAFMAKNDVKSEQTLHDLILLASHGSDHFLFTTVQRI
ncbi:hypothetical protein A1Q_3964 [Vibrio campbellii HY01]|nr:hypothetical protein A1Q_3964 [Vibrio campbellii HY01]